ncbi:MAG: hypothetical protein QW175_06950 [Candidatus Bathyarchaeia archaeon]
MKRFIGSGKQQTAAGGCTAQPLLFSRGKCDVCLAEGPVAYIRQLDRFYCRRCLETAAGLILELEVKG